MANPSEQYDKQYVGFSNLLRTWFTTYGIAFLAFIASQKEIVEALKGDRRNAYCILIVTLVGISLQAMAAMLYKYSMAYLSKGEAEDTFKSTRRFKTSKYLEDAYWFEIVIDLGTIALLIFGTAKLIITLV